jgi:hypothetical protein
MGKPTPLWRFENRRIQRHKFVCIVDPRPPKKIPNLSNIEQKSTTGLGDSCRNIYIAPNVLEMNHLRLARCIDKILWRLLSRHQTFSNLKLLAMTDREET